MNIEIIWKEYQKNLKAFLHKNIANPADVDDLLQEILIKSYQNLNAIKDTKKIKSWLFQIANNTIIDFYRKRAKITDLDSKDLWSSETEENILGELSGCVLPFINGLADEEAQLLRAIEIEGVSQKEYAIQNNLKYSTLKSRVKKSRQRLYRLFDDCCEFSLDSRGNLNEFIQKKTKCSRC